jgi:thiol-disulfide isomerase/thioredoxin
MIKTYFSLFLLGIFICQEALCQTKFEAKLIFPESIKKDKIEISIDNGKESKDITFELHDNQVVLSDTFYSKFAAIEIRYVNEEDRFHPFYTGFFVSEKPAIIRFIQSNGKNSIGNHSIENAVNMEDNEDTRKFRSFVEKEDNDFWNYYKNNHEKIANNDTVQLMLQQKADIVLNKKTKFFKQCSGSYFCLWLFKREVVYNNTISADSLLTIFQNAFSESLRSSFEGDEIMKIIRGRSEKINMLAPNFIANDINGNKVSLDMFRGSYVLIDFWASWCAPCIKKIPDLKEIRKKYSEENLKILFITQDNNLTSFSNAVNKHKIDFGIHLFSTSDLINLYGAQTIPKTFLIDPKGIIIYNNHLEKDFDPDSLILNQLLNEKIK